MAYNYGPPPGAYQHNRQSSYGYPGAGGGPPSMGAPPGMSAAPGMPSQSPGGQQQHFQPPPNMPNINFNAPVIRLGVQDQQKPSSPADRLTAGQGGGREPRGSNAEPIGRRDRMGLGAGGDSGKNLERDRAAVRESMMALQPPTREEVARTIFIGGLSEGTPDDRAIESILQCAGKLRRWTRARDADDLPCKFGFAEYEDVESLEAANEIFVDVEVALLKNGMLVKDEETEEIKKAKLLVVVDEQSKNYIDEWKGRRKEDDDARQFRIDGCKEDLRQALAAVTNVGAFMANGVNGERNGEDTVMGEVNGEQSGETSEVLSIPTIPLAIEDELSDIPAEMRATVAEEIRAFRERSNRRDIERMKREEDLEQAERTRASGGRVNRLASPPPTGAPSGPASAANGVPVGPKSVGVQGAPAGPRGYRGAQMPSDYVNGVSFVGANGFAINREDEDAPESDEELEQRRKKKREEELEKQFEDAKRRWLNRERQRAAAQEREKAREAGEDKIRDRDKEEWSKKLSEWDDDEQIRLNKDEYYSDHAGWMRRRIAFRDREQKEDEKDREDEAREKAEERRRAAEARGMAENFMDQMSSELEASAADQSSNAAAAGFKMSLGSAAARNKAAQQAAATQSAPKRANMADVEGLLEDEEDAAATGVRRAPRELKPLPSTSTVPSSLTDNERAEGRQALAAEIPTATEDLFAYPLKHQYLTKAVIDERIRPFVEKKVVEYLGVQEDLLVDMVVEGLEERKGAKEIARELEEAMEDEGEVLVKKVWRLCVFWTECEARGLN